MRRAFRLFLLALSLAPAAVRADPLMDLEAGNFAGLEKSRAEAESAGRAGEAEYDRALDLFYHGDLSGAESLLATVSTETVPSAAWLKNYLKEVRPVVDRLQPHESEHFVLRTDPDDGFLADYALKTLEKAYRTNGAELDEFPQGKVPVEIYRRREDFIAASTLSDETLERSGAIGICKFRRLMILSPENLAFGYRWLDTLAHEYTHFLINAASGGRCPLWLHEGTAKHLETLWRMKVPETLTPGNRTELARALKDDKLVPFSRMEPSMVYLDNQEQVRLAFSEVADAARTIQALKPHGLRLILRELAAGHSRAEAFQTVLGLTMDGFESRWKENLRKEDLQESPGSAPDVLELGKGDEIEAFAGPGIRAHIRLGDRMRLAGENEAALIQYRRALDQEPDNPVALVKAARTLVALGRGKEAVGALETSVRENPNYEPAFLLLGERKLSQGDAAGAQSCFSEANALNPFNPQVHLGLAQSLQALGKNAEAQREIGIARDLASQGR